MKKKSSNCYYYSSYYVVIAVFLVGSMIGDYFNNNILGGSNGNTNIFVHAKNTKKQALTQQPTSEPNSDVISDANTMMGDETPCGICGDGLVILKPDATIKFPDSIGIFVTCALAEGFCMSGACTPEICAAFADGISDACGCALVGGGDPTAPSPSTRAPTRKPTQRPTQAPTQQPTYRPTQQPTPVPTPVPTPAPTPAPTVSAIFFRFFAVAPGLTKQDIIADQFTKTAYEVLFGTEDNAISRNANNDEDNEDEVNVRHLSHHHRFIRRNLQGDDGTTDDGTTVDTTTPFVPGTSEYDQNVVKIKSIPVRATCTAEYGECIEEGKVCYQVFMEIDSVDAVLSKADLDQIGSDIASTVESGVFQDILVTGGLDAAVFVPAPTQAPTREPTRAPTRAPTQAPTREPTQRPTQAPTEEDATPAPTNGFPTAPSPPTQRPTQRPTRAPTRAPTRRPTTAPTNGFPTAPSPPTQRPTTEPIWGGATPAPTQAPTPAPATPEPTKDPARERISRFVEEGQMFFVRENQIALGRNSSSPIFPSMTNQFNNIEWFCKPAFSPANNNDGNYNNVISSFITFKLDINKFGDTGGFTAAWSVGTTNFGGSYEEYGTDYTIRTNRYNDVGDSSRSSTIQWTLDGLGSTSGLVTSGEGRWTFDTTESIFDVFKEALNGRELTGETCKAIYNEIYVEETTRNPTQAPKEKKSRKSKKTNKNRKSERKLQTTLLEDNYDVKENKEYVSLKAQVDKLEKTVAVLLLRLDETITRAS